MWVIKEKMFNLEIFLKLKLLEWVAEEEIN